MRQVVVEIPMDPRLLLKMAMFGRMAMQPIREMIAGGVVAPAPMQDKSDANLHLRVPRRRDDV